MKRNARLQEWVILLLLLPCCTVTETVRQNPTQPIAPRGFSGSVFLRLPRLKVPPASDVEIPANIRAAYGRLDSLVRNTDHEALRSFLKGVQAKDSLRDLVRDIMLMQDYDPVKFFQYTNSNLLLDVPRRGRISRQVIPKVEEAADRVYKDNDLTYRLLRSSYITHASALRVEFSRDTPLFGPRVRVQVRAIDKIKGQRLPPCDTTIGAISDASTCIQFEYLAGAPRLEHQDSSFGVDWIGPGQEYILFLSLGSLKFDSSFDYAYIGHVGKFWPTMGGMYPIKDGYVVDPYDDFGFHARLTVAEFKRRLRAKIELLLAE